ncbi:MAG TPA: hypothetical protein VG838_12635 [Opitutaceae bacterium]|nr:hypothetical protein [Opitutaceae bacterium]
MKSGALLFFPCGNDKNDDWVRETLDQCGLSYRTVGSGEFPARAPGLSRVECGADSVAPSNRGQLMDFLWAHGAKTEDS